MRFNSLEEFNDYQRDSIIEAVNVACKAELTYSKHDNQSNVRAIICRTPNHKRVAIIHKRGTVLGVVEEKNAMAKRGFTWSIHGTPGRNAKTFRKSGSGPDWLSVDNWDESIFMFDGRYVTTDEIETVTDSDEARIGKASGKEYYLALVTLKSGESFVSEHSVDSFCAMNGLRRLDRVS